MDIKKLFGFKKEERKAVAVPCSSIADALFYGEIGGNYCAMNLSSVFKAVNLISDSIAILPVLVKKEAEDGEIEILKNHPVALMFKDRAGGIISKFLLLKLLIQSVLLRGNGFAYINRDKKGQPVSLRYLEANDVTINYNKATGNLYYHCSLVGGVRIEPRDMIHLVKHTYDGVNGVSVITYANRSISIANQSENNAKNFFANGSNLNGIITVNGTLTDKQKGDIANNWWKIYGGGSNNGGVAVLQGNMTYSPISVNPKDAQLLESRLFNTEEIARWFSINPILLGDLSHTQYNAIESVQLDFLQHTLAGYVKMVECEFNRKLLMPNELDCTIDLDEKEILKADKAATVSYYNSLLSNGVLSINEVRRELGYSPIADGDKHIIAYTDVEQNTINKEGTVNENN